MVIVPKPNMHNYYDKQRREEIIKYFNGVKKTKFENGAIYFPRQLYNGDGIFGDIFNLIAKNKDTISNVASAASSIVYSIGKVGFTTVDIVKKARKLKNKQPITDDAVNEVLNASEVKGSGFFYV